MNNIHEEEYTHILIRGKVPVAKFHSRAAAEAERNRMQRVSLQLGRTQDNWSVAAASDENHDHSDKTKSLKTNQAKFEAELEKSRAAYRKQLERKRGRRNTSRSSR